MTLLRALLITVVLAALSGGCTVHRHYQTPQNQGQIRHPGYAVQDPGYGSEDQRYAGAPGGYYDERDARGPERVDDGYAPRASENNDPRCNCKCGQYAERPVHKRYEPDNASDWLE